MENTAPPNQPPSIENTPLSNQPQPIRNSSKDAPLAPHSHTKYYLFLVLILLVGLAIGYFLNNTKNTQKISEVPTKKIVDEIKLPPDAKMIEECAKGYGTLYSRPQDVPLGPTYQVWKGKVIAVAYMVPKDKFMNDQDMMLPHASNIKADHVSITFIPNGHMGLPVSHYFISLYTIDKKTYDSYDLSCPNSIMEMDMKIPASGSAMPEMTTAPEVSPIPSATLIKPTQ